MKIIDVFICKLRKKLQSAGTGHLITTVWGQGYVLRDEVSPVHMHQGNAMAQATTA